MIILIWLKVSEQEILPQICQKPFLESDLLSTRGVYLSLVGNKSGKPMGALFGKTIEQIYEFSGKFLGKFWGKVLKTASGPSTSYDFGW